MPTKKPDVKKTPTPVCVTKYRMAMTDTANFAEKVIDAEHAAQNAAWDGKARTVTECVLFTAAEYRAAGDMHRAIAATVRADTRTGADARADRHMAVADAMTAIGTREWNPAAAAKAAKAAADAAKAKADAIAAVRAQMAALGVDPSDL